MASTENPSRRSAGWSEASCVVPAQAGTSQSWSVGCGALSFRAKRSGVEESLGKHHPATLPWPQRNRPSSALQLNDARAGQAHSLQPSVEYTDSIITRKPNLGREYRMTEIDSLTSVLQHRGRHDLAKLLSKAHMELIEIDEGYIVATGDFMSIMKAVISAPIEDYDQLKSLSQSDNGYVLGVLQEIFPYEGHAGDMAVTEVAYRLDTNMLGKTTYDTGEVLQNVDWLKNLMIDVATGGARINTVNDRYKEEYSRLSDQLAAFGLQNPIPYSDLWQWFTKWRSGDLPTYHSRRQYIFGLYEPVERSLREGISALKDKVFPEPTGWARVDRTLGEMRTRLAEASTEEQYQAVGLLCRETLISLAQAVFDAHTHATVDGVQASDTDAKRMLEGYLATEVGGESNESARKHAKATIDFAVTLQHKRTASFREAALCAEATASVVNVVAIISGIRDPR